MHAALTSLPAEDQARPGVTASRAAGPHQLTCRQTEHTFRLMTRALARDDPDGTPSPALQATCDRLLEASIPAPLKNATTSLAADRADAESWSRPPRHGTTACHDPEASRGHRNTQPARPQRRDVLRLLPLGPDHGPRGNRPGRPRAGPPHDRLLLPPGPRPRTGPRPAENGRRRHPARRPPGRFRLLLPRPRRLGHPGAPGRRRPGR